MEVASRQTVRQLRPSTAAAARLLAHHSSSHLSKSAIPTVNRIRRRDLSTTRRTAAPENSLLNFGTGGQLGGVGGGAPPATYFANRSALPVNTVVRFVPQQTAWIVERMGKFHRILEPGLAILIPFLDRIAYVKSLKESAIEIPSQNAITADNVTLELDGVLYTRVFDAFKAR